MLKYEWAPTYEALLQYSKVSDGSPFDGIMMNYVNPVRGGPVMQTIGASMQMLRPGERTGAHRHTGSFVFRSPRGPNIRLSVASECSGKKETFFVCRPGICTSMRMARSPRTPACTASNDLPVMWSLGLYREEALGDNGGYQTVAS